LNIILFIKIEIIILLTLSKICNHTTITMEYPVIVNPTIEEEKRILQTELNKLRVINSKESTQLYIILMLNLRNIMKYRWLFFPYIFIEFWYNNPQFAKYILKFIIKSDILGSWVDLGNILMISCRLFYDTDKHDVFKNIYPDIFKTISRIMGIQILIDWYALIKYMSDPNSKPSLCVSGCIMSMIFESNNTLSYYKVHSRKEKGYHVLNGKTFMQYFIENNKDLIRFMVSMCKNNDTMRLIFQETIPFSKWKQFNRWNSTSWDNIVANLKKHPNRFNNNNMALKVILSLISNNFSQHSPGGILKDKPHERFNTIEEFIPTAHFYQEWINNKTDNKLMNMNDDIILNILVGSSNTDLINYIGKLKKN